MLKDNFSKESIPIFFKSKDYTFLILGSDKSAFQIVTDLIENNLDYILSKQNESGISIVLHPFIYAYYREGLISKQMKWFLKYRIWVKLIKDSSIGITEFHFLNKLGDEIEIG
jgi:ribonuclease G